MTSSLLLVTAMVELGAGLALLSCPSATASLLVGAPLEAPAALTVARVAGAGLLALGVACWFTRGQAQNSATRGLIAAMSLYNITAVIVLAYAGIGYALHGIALWPAVLLHVGLAAWCIASLVHTPALIIETTERNTKEQL